jgi:hypothetical protein
METFESFEALFQKAIYFEDIETAEGKFSPEVKAALNSINQTFFEQAFWIWLQNKKAFNFEQDSIQPFLTEENWIEFFREHSKQAETAHADYLKQQAERKKKIYAEEPLSEQQVPQMPPVPIRKQMIKGDSGLTQAEFALKCFYEYEVSKDGEKWKISTDPVRFASDEGWKSPYSGKKLVQKFNDIQKHEIRIGQWDNSEDELKANKKRIENVKPQLTGKARQKAEDELELVQNLIKEHSIHNRK